MSKRVSAVLAALVLLLILLLPAWTCADPSVGAVARPSVNGRLHVEGIRLTDASGKAVQLRGVSTHGLVWYPDMVSENLFQQVSKDWNCN